MKKSDLFASVSHYAVGEAGLNHYVVERQREHMDELVVKAEANTYGKIGNPDYV